MNPQVNETEATQRPGKSAQMRRMIEQAQAKGPGGTWVVDGSREALGNEGEQA